MRLAQKVLVAFCLTSLFFAIPGVTRVWAQPPPPPKLQIVTGMDGTESYCLGQTIEFAALVTAADDPSIRPELVTVTIVDDTGTRELKTNSDGFVHWKYGPADEGTHSIRLEAVGGLMLPADPVTFKIQVKQCYWELTLIYSEVGGLDFDEAGGMELKASVGYQTTFTVDKDGKIVMSSKDPGKYEVSISPFGPAASICQMQGQPAGPIYIEVAGSVYDGLGLDVQLSAPMLSLAGTRANCGMVNTDKGEIPVDFFTEDNVDFIHGADISNLFFVLEGDSVSKDFGRPLFWPEFTSTTSGVVVYVKRVDK